jgi:predicted nucleic acid-binding protein
VSFLLDTNVVSELVRPRPNPGLVEWLAERDEDQVFLSVVTLAELRYGIARLPVGRRRRSLEEWLRGGLLQRFDGRILPVDDDVALTWGDVTAECAAAGRPIEAMDALIAATVRVRALELVTRNTRDFEAALIPVHNPWAGAG